MRNSVPMRDYGNMIQLTGYPNIHKDGLRPHKEPAFFEYLFGFSFNEPCICELEDHCGCVNISHMQLSAEAARDEAEAHRHLISFHLQKSAGCPKIINIDSKKPLGKSEGTGTRRTPRRIRSKRSSTKFSEVIVHHLNLI